MPFDKNIYKTPFWVEDNGYKTGRDPLGILDIPEQADPPKLFFKLTKIVFCDTDIPA